MHIPTEILNQESGLTMSPTASFVEACKKRGVSQHCNLLWGMFAEACTEGPDPDHPEWDLNIRRDWDPEELPTAAGIRFRLHFQQSISEAYHTAKAMTGAP
jgi:hypothetical protein